MSNARKRFEIINQTPSPIVINSLNIVVRPPPDDSETMHNRAFINESMLDDGDLQFLVRKNKVVVVEVQPESVLGNTAVKSGKKGQVKQPKKPGSEMGGEVTVMHGTIPVKKNLKSTILHEGFEPDPIAPPPQAVSTPGYLPDIIDPDSVVAPQTSSDGQVPVVTIPVPQPVDPTKNF